MKEFLYIIQASLESTKCKIGITNDIERRLKEYSTMTGKSKDNIYNYLFTCEVKNMRGIEKDVKNAFLHLREQANKEMYFYNESLFIMYIDFIKSHSGFIKEVFIKKPEKQTIIKVVPKTTPSLEERGLNKQALLNKARRKKDDEFYTRYEDIEKELCMYPKSIWKDKVVFCNCDDAVGENRDYKDSSAFALFFIKNFFQLGLKKLICTHYGTPTDLFNAGRTGYIFTKDGVSEIKNTPKGYDGSFDSPLSLDILKTQADIVCTNPPFSRMRDYWKILIESKKKFIIISNITNAKNNAYLPYFAKKQVWAGYNRIDWFLNPKRELVDAAGHWYTNIKIKNRPKYRHLKIMPLDEIPEKYKYFDDNGILVVDNCYIPSNYEKKIAVSVRTILNGILEKGYNIFSVKQYDPIVNGKVKFGRTLIQKINS